MRSLLVFLVFLLGCATAEDDTGLVVKTDAATDSASPTDTGAPVDTGTPDEDAAIDTASPPTDTGPCKLVINELQTGDGTSGNADFVELYNGCGTAASVGKFKVVYRSSSGTTDTVLFTFADGASISPKGFRVLGGMAFTGSKDGALASGLAVGGGSVALKDDGDSVVDSVAWGSGTGIFVEGSAAPAPGDTTPAKSLARTPDGADSDNNASDFKVSNPTPGAAN